MNPQQVDAEPFRHLALWLLPAEEDAVVLQRLVDELARRFGVSSFEPHLTLHSGPFAADRTPELPGLPSPLELEVESVEATPLFTQTLLLRFSEGAPLAPLAESFRKGAAEPSGYELRPHLSLLYADLPLAEKLALARETRPPMNKVRFDRLCLVEHSANVATPEDVATFKVLRGA